jgi:class 3 adenylate cyclase/tetratricopeptide (TPR) repeat protein
MRPEPSGASLQISASQMTLAAEERRMVTVLFADLTGSTALGERLDPEDMRDVLERFFETLAREVVKLEGSVDKYVGDEVMAVFGAPIAHEDDAARAVTAAAAMQEAMSSLNSAIDARHAVRLALRIGINTGEVVAGPLAGSFQSAYTVVGDTVNTAKRLQALARPGDIVVGERTKQATARRFEFVPLPPMAAKGKAAPLQNYRYVGPRMDPGRSSTQDRPALVARVVEREALLAAVTRASGGTGGIVAIVGDPGIGKTRLLAEARAAAGASGVAWLQGQATSQGQTLSYLPFREMLRTFAGIDASDDDDLKWSKLERVVSDVLGAQATDILPYVGQVLTLRLPEGDAERVASLDGEGMRRQVLRSAFLLFEAMARARPTAIVFEDWHSADRSSEQLLAHLLPLSDRLLFIWTGRTERDSAVDRTLRLMNEIAPERSIELALAPLSADDSASLVCQILDTASLPGGLRDAVVRRAEGNPFFAEEILRALRDLRVLTRDDAGGEWTLAEQHDAGTLPTTVQGLIAARVDRLSDSAREVARIASVIGRTFPYRLLVAASPNDVDRGLEELLRGSVVRERGRGERSYTFTHALIQETVYAGLLVRTRRELHARVGAAMEVLLGERIEEQYGVLASHFAQAEKWNKAQEYLFKVGDQALRIAADAEAVDHYERALEAYGRAFGDRWDTFDRAAVERKIGEARYRLGEFERAKRHLDRALQLLGFPRPGTRNTVRAAILGELLRQIWHRLAPRLKLRSRPAAVSEAVLQTLWFQQFIDYSVDLERLLYDILRTLNIAEGAGPSHRTLRAYFGMTLMCHNVGLRGMGSRYARMAQGMAAEVGGPLADALACASLGLDHYALGRWTDATSDLASAAAGYLAVGELEPWAAVNTYLNAVLVGRGLLDEALPIGGDLERTGRAARDQRIEALGTHCRASVLAWSGHEREAATEYGRAMAQHRAIPDHHLWIASAGYLALTQIRMQATEDARELVAEGTALAREHRLRGWLLTPLLTARAELLLRDAAAGGTQRADLLRQAERASRQLRAQCRLHYEAIPAAFRVAGAIEWQRGRPDRARDAWARSLAAAERMGALTEQFETHDAIARYTASVVDRSAADQITTRMRGAVAASVAS